MEMLEGKADCRSSWGSARLRGVMGLTVKCRSKPRGDAAARTALAMLGNVVCTVRGNSDQGPESRKFATEPAGK